MNYAKACDGLLNTFKDVQFTLTGSWADCERLCKRCEIFRPLINTYFEDPSILEINANNEIFLLRETEKLLRSIFGFVNELMQRSSYYGATELSARLAFTGDIARLTHQITKLSMAMNLPVDDFDTDTRRKEDLEV